jgi:hypothetical protein
MCDTRDSVADEKRQPPGRTTDNLEARLLGLINDSGFPFQLAVKREIERSSSRHGWKVVASEHQWTHERTPNTGFVDLVIRHDRYEIVRVTLECKRVKQGSNWVFLTPTDSNKSQERVSLFWVGNCEDWPNRTGWIDLPFEPATPEAAFCTIHGQDERQRQMLERLADDILPATEAVCLEEFRHVVTWGGPFPATRLCLPAIVTNAKLYTATFDPGNVNLDSGRLSPEACKFDEVSCVRFRKGLSSPGPRRPRTVIEKSDADVLKRMNEAGERTILVFNSSQLASTLERFRTPDSEFRRINDFLGELLKTDA